MICKNKCLIVILPGNSHYNNVDLATIFSIKLWKYLHTTIRLKKQTASDLIANVLISAPVCFAKLHS